MCGRLDLKPDLPAQAQGANACSIGRPYLYGLAAGGQTGVERALELLRAEIERAMALLGVSSVDQIGLEPGDTGTALGRAVYPRWLP